MLGEGRRGRRSYCNNQTRQRRWKDQGEKSPMSLPIPWQRETERESHPHTQPYTCVYMLCKSHNWVYVDLNVFECSCMWVSEFMEILDGEGESIIFQNTISYSRRYFGFFFDPPTPLEVFSQIKTPKSFHLKTCKLILVLFHVGGGGR